MNRTDTLGEILATLKQLATELKTEPAGDDGIPVLTTAVAKPTPVDTRARAIGAPIPTLSAVVARPEGQTQVDAFAESQARALRAQLHAEDTLRRFTRIWRESGRPALSLAIIAAIERALTEALQNDTDPQP
ncbi:MAG: hypothetical protein M0Z76_06555 [Gammaproteobacteria bacterium]|nr:hypothetical protein [Gammaproteobacteria bacterium]